MSKPEAALESAQPETSPVEESSRSASDTSSPLSASDGGEETASLLKQLTVGATVDGKYKIDEVIGRGAMGVVVAATHIHLKEKVALKFLNAKAHTQATDFHSRFRREAQVSAKLRNEHITRVIDVGVWREKVPFMVMDHLVGDDLRRVLKANGKLPLNVAIDYVIQMCEGLAEAHSHGIVHRDLKPSNLFVTKRPDGTELIKILDFGISKWSQQEETLEELTQTGVVLGSPKYMSPEQLFGSASVDARADVWSIGAMFYEMLTGKPPFDFPTLTRICAELASDKSPPSIKLAVPDIPDQLEAVVMMCFVRDRDHRIPNVAELAGAILDAVEAPFAEQVRSKVAAVLDPKSQKDLSTTTSSGGLALNTGNYRSLSITGTGSSGPQRLSSSGAIRLALDGSRGPVSAGTAGGVEAEIIPVQEPGKRRVLFFGIAVGAVLALVAIFFVMNASKTPAESKEPSSGPASISAGGAAVATTQTVATPPTTAVATAQPAAPSTAPADSGVSAAATPAPATHGGGGGGWHPHHGGGRPAPPPPPPVVTAAPAATPAAAPTPTPKPAAPVNPLEDRQ